MCHITKIGEDDKAREEAGEGVDSRCDQTVSVAVIVKLVVAGIGQVHTKSRTNAVEYLDSSVNPNL